MSTEPASPGGDESTLGSARSKVEQLGVYWPRSSWDLARSAYWVDLDTDPDSPAVFANWLVRAIKQHAARSPAARTRIADQIPTTQEGRGSSRGHRVGRATIDIIETAIVNDRQHGRIVSRAAFVREATHAASEAARVRLGRPLPPPPARLTSRPPRLQP